MLDSKSFGFTTQRQPMPDWEDFDLVGFLKKYRDDQHLLAGMRSGGIAAEPEIIASLEREVEHVEGIFAQFLNDYFYRIFGSTQILGHLLPGILEWYAETYDHDISIDPERIIALSIKLEDKVSS